MTHEQAWKAQKEVIEETIKKLDKITEETSSYIERENLKLVRSGIEISLNSMNELDKKITQ